MDSWPHGPTWAMGRTMGPGPGPIFWGPGRAIFGSASKFAARGANRHVIWSRERHNLTVFENIFGKWHPEKWTPRRVIFGISWKFAARGANRHVIWSHEGPNQAIFENPYFGQPVARQDYDGLRQIRAIIRARLLQSEIRAVPCRSRLIKNPCRIYPCRVTSIKHPCRIYPCRVTSRIKNACRAG